MGIRVDGRGNRGVRIGCKAVGRREGSMMLVMMSGKWTSKQTRLSQAGPSRTRREMHEMNTAFLCALFFSFLIFCSSILFKFACLARSTTHVNHPVLDKKGYTSSPGPPNALPSDPPSPPLCLDLILALSTPITKYSSPIPPRSTNRFPPSRNSSLRSSDFACSTSRSTRGQSPRAVRNSPCGIGPSTRRDDDTGELVTASRR